MKVVVPPEKAGKWIVTLGLMGEEKLWACTLIVLPIGFNLVIINNTGKHYLPC